MYNLYFVQKNENVEVERGMQFSVQYSHLSV